MKDTKRLVPASDLARAKQLLAEIGPVAPESIILGYMELGMYGREKLILAIQQAELRMRIDESWERYERHQKSADVLLARCGTDLAMSVHWTEYKRERDKQQAAWDRWESLYKKLDETYGRTV